MSHVNQGILWRGADNFGDPITQSTIIDAEIVDELVAVQPLNDDIMTADGITLRAIFFGPYSGPGPGPGVPSEPVTPGDPTYIEQARLYEVADIRLFEVEDNRIFDS
jgi:hypothetical protein